MNREEFIEILRSMKREMRLEKIFPMLLEFLTMKGIKAADKKIPLLTQTPVVLQNIIDQAVSYYCKKFNVIKVINSQNQTIAYY